MMETVMMCAPICKEAISAPVSREISPSIKRISKHALVSAWGITLHIYNVKV